MSHTLKGSPQMEPESDQTVTEQAQAILPMVLPKSSPWQPLSPPPPPPPILLSDPNRRWVMAPEFVPRNYRTIAPATTTTTTTTADIQQHNAMKLPKMNCDNNSICNSLLQTIHIPYMQQQQQQQSAMAAAAAAAATAAYSSHYGYNVYTNFPTIVSSAPSRSPLQIAFPLTSPPVTSLSLSVGATAVAAAASTAASAAASATNANVHIDQAAAVPLQSKPQPESQSQPEQPQQPTPPPPPPPIKTYADVVRRSTVQSQQPPPQVPESVDSNCRCLHNGLPRCFCDYRRGDYCDMCQRYVLHPYDEVTRKAHQTACLKQHEKNMELSFAVARSKDKTCGICFEIIMDKSGRGQRFGILPNCNHIFCLDCIRKWRQARQFENKIIRACPECRITSDFVCPSPFWVDTKEDKDKLLVEYRKALNKKDCKHFNKGRGTCPFGNKCFYKHALPNGVVIDVGIPQRRARRQNHAGEVDVIQQLLLWDFMDDRDQQWLDELASILSEQDSNEYDNLYQYFQIDNSL